MDGDESHKEMLSLLQEEALDFHVKLKDRIVCDNAHKDEADVAEWSRAWRKKVEKIYYTCHVAKIRETDIVEAAEKSHHIRLSPCEKSHHLGPKIERCILAIKEKPEGEQSHNPYAVCRASISRPVCHSHHA